MRPTIKANGNLFNGCPIWREYAPSDELTVDIAALLLPGHKGSLGTFLDPLGNYETLLGSSNGTLSVLFSDSRSEQRVHVGHLSASLKGDIPKIVSYEVSDEYLGQNVLGAMSAVLWSLTGRPPTGLSDEDYEHYDEERISGSTERRASNLKWSGTDAVKVAAQANDFTSDSHPELIFENWLVPHHEHPDPIQDDVVKVPLEIYGTYAALVRASSGELSFIVFHFEEYHERGANWEYLLSLEYLAQVDDTSLAPLLRDDPGVFLEGLQLTIRPDCDYFEMELSEGVGTRYLRPDIAGALQALTNLFAKESLRLTAEAATGKSLSAMAEEVS